MERKSGRGRPRSVDVPPLGELAAHFGQEVRRAREARGWNQTQLAKAVAIQLGKRDHEFHPTTLAKVERGTRPTPLDEAAAIAHVLGQPLHQMLGARSQTREALLVAAAEHSSYVRELGELRLEAQRIASRIAVVEGHAQATKEWADALQDELRVTGDGEH